MRSAAKRVLYFNAHANALGGVVRTPVQSVIPSQASSSLPAVGGHAMARTEQFSFEHIVSCRAAHTRVVGAGQDTEGPWSALVTSIVEGLNILEVVTAERIVAQISVDDPKDGSQPRYSFAGSRFEGLRIGGYAVELELNETLMNIGGSESASMSALRFKTFEETGQVQAGKLLGTISQEPSDGPNSWLFDRFGWMNRDSGKDGLALCSLVDQIPEVFPGRAFGHVLGVPDFGRIFLGELLVTPRSVQIAMIRAELGCTTTAEVTGGTGGIGSHTVPP